MSTKRYSNFVRPSADLEEEEQSSTTLKPKPTVISGDEARRLYLEEVNCRKSPDPLTISKHRKSELHRHIDRGDSVCKLKKHRNIDKDEDIIFTNKDLFLTVQNNDINKIRFILDRYCDKINIVDDYGWSLLMIACQANSIDTVKELLNRGIDTSITDKAGNSARSLVIKNKNHVLADILLNHRDVENKLSVHHDRSEQKSRADYLCNVCNKTFSDRDEHLSSTLHNISASKGKKIMPHYVIPPSNRGFQLLIKGGWNKELGLGRDGTGKKYPIKTVQKKDRKGLGHKKIDHEIKSPERNIKLKSKKMFFDNYKQNRRFEINFRREFY